MKLHQKLDCSFWYSREEKFWFRERKRKNIQHQQKQQIILIRLFNLLLFQLVNSTIVLFLDSNPMKLSYFSELFCQKWKKIKDVCCQIFIMELRYRRENLNTLENEEGNPTVKIQAVYSFLIEFYSRQLSFIYL